MNFYPSEFINDANVLCMSFSERGLYITLLCRAWEMDVPGILPGDERLLQRLAGATDHEWAAALPALRRCFSRDDGRWIQRRMVAEHREQTERIKRISEAGKRAGLASGEARRSQRISNDPLNGRSTIVQPSSSSSSSSSPLTPEKKKRERPRARGLVPISEANILEAVKRFSLAEDRVRFLADRITLEATERGYRNLPSALLNWCDREASRTGVSVPAAEPDPMDRIKAKIAELRKAENA